MLRLLGSTIKNIFINEHMNNPKYILQDFDDKLRLVMDTGYDLDDRTGVGCRFLPGLSIKIDISERIPVPVRRKTAWKSMLKEYLWFLTGSDKISDLENMGSKVWNPWKNPNWAKSKGFDEDSIGYGYGPNLINSGAELGEKGVNQVDYVINLLKNQPNSRRILWDFWRADKVHDTVLNPCHIIYQWVVEDGDQLSCIVYGRSIDLFIGAGSTNLQGAAFLTHMIAQQVNMNPSTLTFCIGHAHIYHNHFDAVEEYLSRSEPNSPILKLNKQNSIYDYTADDFTLTDYNPLSKIKVEVAV